MTFDESDDEITCEPFDFRVHLFFCPLELFSDDEESDGDERLEAFLEDLDNVYPVKSALLAGCYYIMNDQFRSKVNKLIEKENIVVVGDGDLLVPFRSDGYIPNILKDRGIDIHLQGNAIVCGRPRKNMWLQQNDLVIEKKRLRFPEDMNQIFAKFIEDH